MYCGVQIDRLGVHVDRLGVGLASSPKSARCSRLTRRGALAQEFVFVEVSRAYRNDPRGLDVEVA